MGDQFHCDAACVCSASTRLLYPHYGRGRGANPNVAGQLSSVCCTSLSLRRRGVQHFISKICLKSLPYVKIFLGRRVLSDLRGGGVSEAISAMMIESAASVTGGDDPALSWQFRSGVRGTSAITVARLEDGCTSFLILPSSVRLVMMKGSHVGRRCCLFRLYCSPSSVSTL